MYPIKICKPGSIAQFRDILTRLVNTLTTKPGLIQLHPPLAFFERVGVVSSLGLPYRVRY